MPQPLPAFVQGRTPVWDDLAALVAAADGRIDRLDPASVRRLGRRYREAVADLAQARRRFPGDPVTDRLDLLVRQARPLVYGSVTTRTSVAEFATTGYWRRVRERPVFLLVAALTLFGPALLIGVWSNADPAGAARVAEVSPLTRGLSDDGPRDPDTQKVTDPTVNTGFSAQIFTNNARVALVAFAGGLSAGVLTIASLAFNGLVLGLVAGIAVQGGNGDSLWRLVVPHGVLELSLIVVSGAAGLRTGWALVHPGHRTRVEALAVEGRAGVELALGSAFLLVPCGLVEGFVTPRGLSLPAALAVGSSLGAAYWALVLWRGRPAATGEPGT
ncbi:stage II sporulation protein M [Aquihabitans sp. G128]|uniref:stage II sporulation protein M n=1 Tax=Aquihabitans sp. G128 TaxID=2849779 RepID=UPI001C2163C6|nr:stage II sporulation protein M [Aquihabitans sp. G128]QXC61387.1 stage II sporulation protein M [Aquihabitans sp. G128]